MKYNTYGGGVCAHVLRALPHSAHGVPGAAHARWFKEEEVGRESATSVLSRVDTHTVQYNRFVFVFDIRTS